MRIGRRALASVLAATALPARAANAIRVGALRFGSLAWELDVMRQHGLRDGFALEVIEFAAGPASQVALQAGAVDLVLQDWLWVARQRATGAKWMLAPVPAALGAVMAPAESPIRSVSDLRGKRLGIAGGPLDKSWLLLRLFAQQSAGLDLDGAVEKTFGPPPLIGEQLRAGRLDAALTYWPFAARAEAAGLRAAIDMADVLAANGAPRDLPMLGFAFAEDWAGANRTALQAFLAASQASRAILQRSDPEWERIATLTGAQSPAELGRLRDWYRRGFPGTWDAAAQDAAARLFDRFAAIGGPTLVGPATHLPTGLFWSRD